MTRIDGRKKKDGSVVESTAGRERDSVDGEGGKHSLRLGKAGGKKRTKVENWAAFPFLQG